MIPLAFLEAAKGARLTFDYFERTPGPEMRSAERVAAYGESVRAALAAWWRGAEGAPLGTLDTYYGVHAAETVLERTAWHAAQHARQLMALLEQRGIAPDGPLGAPSSTACRCPKGSTTTRWRWGAAPAPAADPPPISSCPDLFRASMDIRYSRNKERGWPEQVRP